MGSSSAIFASNISGLGARVAFIGRLGDDIFGKMITDDFLKKGIDITMIKMNDSLRTGATIVLNVKEDRAMVTFPGAMNFLTLEDINKKDISRAKHLHLSSYYLQPGLRKDVGKLFKMARESGLTTSFDMQWDPEEKWDIDLNTILPHVNVFFPNETELLSVTNSRNLKEAVYKIREITEIIAVKRGNKGSIIYRKSDIHEVPAFLNERVVDAIGAGDSFNAGFIYKYIKGVPVEECQRFGNLTGAINTTRAGGTMAFQDIELIKKIARENFGITI
jgi:sugar/nucleoside kinase (ribokinase family)